MFSGPILLLTSDNIKQRLGSAALDRYTSLCVGNSLASPSSLLSAGARTALHCTFRVFVHTWCLCPPTPVRSPGACTPPCLCVL